MGVKMVTTEEFKGKVFLKHGDKVHILSEYIGGTSDIAFVYNCHLHGDTYKSMNAKNILSKSFQPCDKCRAFMQSEKGKARASDASFYYNRLKLHIESKGGTLITQQYTTAKALYEVHCGNSEHPNFRTTADSLVNKPQWCPYCSGRSGDFHKQINDIIESKNGTLLSEYKNSIEHVKVKCNIHNYEWDIMPGNIKKGRWCPICNLPHSEKVVYDYLTNNHYKIIVQYKFSDLIGDNNECLKFDFGIIDKNNQLLGLIEVDDEEHRHNHKSERRIKARLRDKAKDTYCNINNIKLYRLEYTRDSELFKDYNWYYKYIDKELSEYLLNLIDE